MGFETLKNIIDWNRAQKPGELEDLENDMCPYDWWPLAENSKGEKGCPICGRIWLGNSISFR